MYGRWAGLGNSGECVYVCLYPLGKEVKDGVRLCRLGIDDRALGCADPGWTYPCRTESR